MLLNHQPQFFNPVVPSMDYHHPHHPHHPPVDAFHAHHHGYFHPSELSLDNSSPSATASPEMCIPPGLVYPPHNQHPTTPLFHAHQLQQQQQQEYVPTAHNPLKRSPSPTPSLSVDDSDLMMPTSPTKKSRNERGERISSKDFVPPDVTGLSKREARLVKNRAAAFLSRQRKREEFEALEVRVQELEMENAHLRNGGSAGAVASPPPPSTSSGSSEDEVTRLRSELSTSTRRCSLLEKDLHRIRTQQQQQIKSEPVEDEHELSSVGSQSPLMPPSLCGASSSSASSEDGESFNSKGMMMALLLLLAPVLSPSSPSSTTTNQPPFFQDAFEPFHGSSAALPINFWDSAPTPSTTTTLSFDHLAPWSAPTPSTSSSFEFDFPPTPSSPKRQVELDVQLTRSPLNPDRVKVKIVEPHSSSFSSSLPMTPPPTASDFLSPALPSSYSFVSGSGAEKKRVKIAVVGENGDWEVEVK